MPRSWLVEIVVRDLGLGSLIWGLAGWLLNLLLVGVLLVDYLLLNLRARSLVWIPALVPLLLSVWVSDWS